VLGEVVEKAELLLTGRDHSALAALSEVVLLLRGRNRLEGASNAGGRVRGTRGDCTTCTGWVGGLDVARCNEEGISNDAASDLRFAVEE